VDAPIRSHAGHALIEKVRETGHDGINGVRFDMGTQGRDIRGIHAIGFNGIQTVGVGHRPGESAVHVSQLYPVVARFAEQTADEGPDFSGAKH